MSKNGPASRLSGASSKRRVRFLANTGEAANATWGVAGEVAVEIGVNGKPFAVMMATPADIEDLALGFTLTEGVIADVADVRGVDVKHFPEGVTADVLIAAERFNEDRLRKRTLEGRAGCGLCGVETLADALRPLEPSAGPPSEVSCAAVERAFAALPDHQELNAATRSVHAAAWCSGDGTLVLAREDVGRHNALDKLVGARARDAGRAANDFFIMTSRCSFELVQKTAAAGVGVLATVSAPTTLALDLALAVGVRVVCFNGGDIVAFEGEDDRGA